MDSDVIDTSGDSHAELLSLAEDTTEMLRRATFVFPIDLAASAAVMIKALGACSQCSLAVMTRCLETVANVVIAMHNKGTDDIFLSVTEEFLQAQVRHTSCFSCSPASLTTFQSDFFLLECCPGQNFTTYNNGIPFAYTFQCIVPMGHILDRALSSDASGGRAEETAIVGPAAASFSLLVSPPGGIIRRCLERMPFINVSNQPCKAKYMNSPSYPV